MATKLEVGQTVWRIVSRGVVSIRIPDITALNNMLRYIAPHDLYATQCDAIAAYRSRIDHTPT
jgi:hypothetical protein